jgi:diguanylate cyclase (GGDEF)-like protein
MERLEQEWAAGSRTQRPMSCLMIDLDQFKLVNDTYGHDIGDLALRQVAATLRKEARTEDLVCRMGGEEFLVIAPDTTLAAAMHLAERLRSAVSRTPFSTGAVSHTSTVSVGVAQRDRAMTHIDELLKVADEGLYEAKRAGRNRVATTQVTPAQGKVS